MKFVSQARLCLPPGAFYVRPTAKVTENREQAVRNCAGCQHIPEIPLPPSRASAIFLRIFPA
ncbi:hypothetical protein HMPREF1548_01725 [Clostridium sp. KLE 1755]|nr:hypothetical protein HMPREF1548_01725 [Clostridium sp. KLE 1755]